MWHDARFCAHTTRDSLLRLAAHLVGCVVFGLCFASGTPARADSAEQRQIDPSRSVAQFSIEHIFVDRVNGSVPILSGSVTIPAGSPIPLSVTAVLDATRINSGDRDRDSSLESPDYFDTKTFPTWTFISTKIMPSGSNACAMDGMLTMHGVTVPEHFDVTVSRGQRASRLSRRRAHRPARSSHMKGARLDPVIGNPVGRHAGHHAQVTARDVPTVQHG